MATLSLSKFYICRVDKDTLAKEEMGYGSISDVQTGIEALKAVVEFNGETLYSPLTCQDIRHTSHKIERANIGTTVASYYLIEEHLYPEL